MTDTTGLIDITPSLTIFSVYTKRAYIRWAELFLQDVLNIADPDLSTIPSAVLLEHHKNLRIYLKVWLSNLKAKGLGKQSIGQARAAVVWLLTEFAEYYPMEEFQQVSIQISKVKSPKAEEGQNPGVWLTNKQLKNLLQSQKPIQKLDPPRFARNTAVLGLMAICGLRRDEVCEAKWSDLHWEGEYRVLSVHGKGEKERKAKLPPIVVELLDRWRKYLPDGTQVIFTRIRRGGHVTSNALTGQAIFNIVSEAADAGKIPHISPHDIRRTFARQAYENGASMEQIRQALGHEQITTTERYVNATRDLDKTASDVVAKTLEKAQKSLKAGSLPPIDPETLLTRAQAAERLGLSIPQFDRLKKQHHLKRVRDLSDDPITNATTRPHNVYYAGDVDRLFETMQQMQQ